MNSSEYSPGSAPKSGRLLFVFGSLLLLAGCLIYAVTSYFRLSTDSAALRDSAAQTLAVEPQKTIDLSIGRFTTLLLKTTAGFCDLPTEAKTVLASLHGVEAGVYTLPGNISLNPAKLVDSTDSTMTKRGWTRIVGVRERDDLVLVYVKDAPTPANLRFCVLVVHNRDLIVASVSGDFRPVAALATQQLKIEHPEIFARL